MLELDKDKGILMLHARVMLIITSGYLLFELAFGARLLDVVGSRATLDEIHAIEGWGRTITGLAITLLILGLSPTAAYWTAPVRLVMAKLGRWRHDDFIYGREIKIGMVVIIVALVVGNQISKFIQQTVQDTAVASASAEDRRAALWLQTMQRAIHDDSVDVAGIDLSAETLRTPAGKAMIALLPVMGWSVGDLESRVRSALQIVVRNEVQDRMGSPARTFNEVFRPSAFEIVELYNKQYRDAHALVEPTSEQVSRVAELEMFGLTRWYRSTYDGGEMTPARRAHIHTYLRNERDMFMPSSFPTTRETDAEKRALYHRAAREKLMRAGEREFARTMHRMLTGETLRDGVQPPRGMAVRSGMSVEEFAMHPAVQMMWKEKIGLAGLSITLRLDMSDTEWRPAHERLISRTIDDRVRTMLGPVSDFQPGGRHAEVGEAAVRAVVIPPIALFFSLLGAGVHLFKMLNWALKSRFNYWLSTYLHGAFFRKLGYTTMALGVTLVVIAIPAFRTNAITESSMFVATERSLIENTEHGWAYAPVIRWTIQAKPYMYPLNEGIRRTILMDYGFGYSGN